MRDLVIGIGCSRGTAASEIVALVELTLADAGLLAGDIFALASIDSKADEKGLVEAAGQFGVPLKLYPAAELALEAERLVNPSARVEAAVGTPGVAEAAALKCGVLIVPKQRSMHATCAIARKTKP